MFMKVTDLKQLYNNEKKNGLIIQNGKTKV